ncbi:hypothetical protein FOL47_011044 [Perkinsus chesapeaki]|uniref:Uncharacterized protein n=1 Tax=Perkinsus chesapeaki TaxID=330153 RepID=A0A7J6L010_PERCH|nr:hypothetical protein FOL47_011044 [Perkinsus chesapeaki]
MQFFQNILLITAFTCAVALELVVVKEPAESTFKQIIANHEGGVYEKPIGHCDSEGKGCSCTAGDRILLAQNHETGQIDAAVCSILCGDLYSCPEPPKGEKECLSHACAMGCNTDNNCLEGGKCITEGSDKACMFPNS